MNTQPCTCAGYLDLRPCPGPDLCPFSGRAARVAHEEQMIAIAGEEERAAAIIEEDRLIAEVEDEQARYLASLDWDVE